MVMRTLRFLLLLTMFILSACAPSKVELLSNVSETSANEIVAALYKAGIESEKIRVKEFSSVLVELEYMAAAVDLLKAQGLPSQNHSTLGEVFKKEGMISTPLEENARYIYALSQELEKTLMQIDNVLIARVHIVLNDQDNVGNKKQGASAAVFIKHLPELDPDTVSSKIRRIVSRSVPGLSEEEPDNVAISFVESELKIVDIKWVDVWGFRMTDKSAVKFKTTISKIAIFSFLIFIIVIFCVLFQLLRQRRQQRIREGQYERENISMSGGEA